MRLAMPGLHAALQTPAHLVAALTSPAAPAVPTVGADTEDAGQQEFLNWVTLGGAMHELKREPEIIDYVESYIFNSDKCFAVFRP